MSKAAVSWICLLLVVLIPVINGGIITGLNSGVNGGVDCAVCSIVLGIVDHLTIVYNESAAQSLERLCLLLPADYKTFCKAAVDFLGKSIYYSFD
jgi:acyloxyacyl hydrolase